MDASKVRPYFLLAVVIGVFILTFLIFKPFLGPIALAAIFAVVLYPVLRFISQYTGKHRGLASLATVLAAIVVILFPLFTLGTLIFNQALEVYFSLAGGNGEFFVRTLTENISSLLGPYIPGLASIEASLAADLGMYAERALGIVISNLGPLVSSITSFFLSLFIFFIALYYLLKDGPALKRYLIELSPLADTDDEAVMARLERAVNSVVRGNLTIALIQGVVSGIGYGIFGLPNSILWGALTGFAALIPGVGTSLVILPAILYLFMTGASGQAIGLIIWGVAAVGLIDNLLGPRLIGRGAQLHPLVILLAVLGGLAFFGPVGIFLGPIAVSLLFALLTVYSAKKEDSIVA